MNRANKKKLYSVFKEQELQQIEQRATPQINTQSEEMIKVMRRNNSYAVVLTSRSSTKNARTMQDAYDSSPKDVP